MSIEQAWLRNFYSAADIAQLTPAAITELYAATQPTQVKIKDLELEDVSRLRVNSLDGFVKIHKWRNKGVKDCYKVVTSSCVLEGSDDHFIELGDGRWQYLMNLTPGDIVKTIAGPESVTSVDATSAQVVYDFHIDHVNHRYFTNGISSHNSGSGKSLFMQNLAVNWVEMGLHGVYITLELSEDLCAMRIDSMMTGTASRDIFKHLDDVELKVKAKAKKSGNLQIKYMPAQSNVNDIRSYIRELQVQSKTTKINFICVDYLDLLMPATAKVNPSDLFTKDKYVSEELRNLAKELNVVLVTASQLNRCLTLDTMVEVNGIKTMIKDVNVGDYLNSNEGPVQVYEVLPITKQLVYKITTKTGKVITCSANHKFPTVNGLKTIGSGLMVGDKLQVFNEITEMFDEIVSIEYVGEQDTIDINTTGNRLFYANDILTHNSAVEEVEFDHSMISGGISKINTADNVFGIFTSRAMRERGKYQLQLMKTRSSAGVGQKIDLDFDVDTLRIHDGGTSGLSVGHSNSAGNILDSIKTRSTVVPHDQTDGKVRADVQSAKLKGLLSKINNG